MGLTARHSVRNCESNLKPERKDVHHEPLIQTIARQPVRWSRLAGNAVCPGGLMGPEGIH